MRVPEKQYADEVHENDIVNVKRVNCVKRWLVGKGISEQIIWTRGWGAAKPVAPNSKPNGADDPDGRQKNRRVEITIKK